MEESGKCHPRIITEMEKMVDKLIEAEKKINSLKDEICRHESLIIKLRNEKSTINNEMKIAEENHLREKTAWVEEIVQLRKKADQLRDIITELEQKLSDSKSQQNAANKKILENESYIKELTEQRFHRRNSTKCKNTTRRIF